jgi:hypothetical protein
VHREWQQEKKRSVTVHQDTHRTVNDKSGLGFVTELFTYKERANTVLDHASTMKLLSTRYCELLWTRARRRHPPPQRPNKFQVTQFQPYETFEK